MLNFGIYLGIIPCEIRALISERRHRIDTGSLSRRKEQTNSHALSARSSIHPAPIVRYLRPRSRAAHLVLSSPMRFAGAAAHASPFPHPPLPPTESMCSPACKTSSYDLLSSPFRASSFSIPPPPSHRCASLVSKFRTPGFFPFVPSPRHLPPLIPLSSREDARVNTCARAMGEKEHGWHMQNVATSIFYSGLFAGIYDAAIGILLLPIYLQRCFFLRVLPYPMLPVLDRARSCISSLSLSLFPPLALSPVFTELSPICSLFSFLSLRFCFFLPSCTSDTSRIDFLSLARWISTFFYQRRFFQSLFDYSKVCLYISRFILYIYFLHFR